MPDFSLSRRQLLRTVPALVTAVVAPKVFAQVREQPYSFLAIGDWGSGGLFRQRHVARRLAEKARQTDSQFVATTGDNFYFWGVNSVSDQHWTTMFENVYDQPSLDIPWYPSLGNHDYYGNPDAQIAYSSTAAGRRNKWYMPSRYYALEGATQLRGQPDVDLFFIDTQALVYKHEAGIRPEMAANLRFEDPTDQLAWLRRQLCVSRARWKFVFGHHPVYSVGDHGNTQALGCLQPLLKQHGVSAYVCGHDHNLQHFREDGVDYVVSGAGSMTHGQTIHDCTGPWFARGTNGFASFTIAGDTCTMDFIDHHGALIYQVDIGGQIRFNPDPCSSRSPTGRVQRTLRCDVPVV